MWRRGRGEVEVKAEAMSEGEDRRERGGEKRVWGPEREGRREERVVAGERATARRERGGERATARKRSRERRRIREE